MNSSIFGALFGLGFLGMGIWMLIYDLVFLHRNNWDFDKHSKMDWGADEQFDGPTRRLASTKTKLLLIYPMFILIPGFVFVVSLVELFRWFGANS